MNLEVKNVGNITNALLMLNGITIVGGENGTGKSTLCRALYSVLSGISVDKMETGRYRSDRLSRIIRNYLFHNFPEMEFYDKRTTFKNIILDAIEKYRCGEHRKPLKEYLIEIPKISELVNTDEFNKVIEQIASTLDVSDDKIQLTIISQYLDEEFNSQIQNVYDDSPDSLIKIENNGKSAEVIIRNNKAEEFWNSLGHYDNSVLYIDDANILDKLAGGRLYSRQNRNHESDLLFKLRHNSKSNNPFDVIELNEKLKEIDDILNVVCNGNFVDGRYREGRAGKKIDIRNLSSGLKTFALLKILMENGEFKENGVLIIDEPETHLHPQWQLKFAEILVLLHKQMDLTILLNSHSPYFIQAVSVYANKYGIGEDKCRFYLAENDNGSSYFTDVTQNKEPLYAKLANPFQILENERWS